MRLKDIDPDFQYPEVTEDIKRYVADRDRELCIVCGKWYADTHHIIYRSQGGTNAPNNMGCMCWEHHNAIHHGKGIDVPKEELLKRIKKNEKRFRSRLI